MTSVDAVIAFVKENLEGVNQLGVDYCRRCLSDEYSSYGQLKEEFECEFYSDEELQKCLLRVAQKVRDYCVVHPDTSQFFEALREPGGIEIPSLTTFLWYCVDTGLQAERSKRELGVALSAASLYLVLVSIKSSKLYRLFDINILQKCLELMKNSEKLLRPLASKVANLSKAKKRDAEAESERGDPLSIGEDVDCFVKLLKDVMRSLFVVLNTRSIADVILESDERCPIIVDFLRDVAYIDIKLASTNYKKCLVDSINSHDNASSLSFIIAHEILAKSSEIRSAAVYSRFIMPYLLFWVGGNSKLAISGALPQVLKDARSVMVRFLSARVDCMNRVEMENFMKTLKTLPLKCFDRAEYRANVAETLVDIFRIVPQLAYYLIDDIYVLGCHNKTQHRSFAYEIVNFLLNKFPFDQIAGAPAPLATMFVDENTIMDIPGANEEVPVEEEPAEEIGDDEAAGDTVQDDDIADNTEQTEQEAEQTEQAEETQAPLPPLRENAERSPDDLEYVRRNMSPKEAMLSLIINGLVDKFAKQKALQTVESLFKNESCREELCKLANKFVNENAEELILIGRVVIKDEPMDETVRQNPEEEAMEVDSQTNSPYYADDLLYLILKGFENDKIAICKHALSTCVNVVLRGQILDPKLFERCVEEIKLKTWDVAIQVRKQAAVCLKELLLDHRYGSEPVVEKAWLSGLLHQVVDNELTVAQQAIKFVTEHIVSGLLKPRPNPTWNLMNIVEHNTEYTRYLAICLTDHAKDQNTTQRTGSIQALIVQLQRTLTRITAEADCPPAAWMLLSELSYNLKVDPVCAANAWDKLQLKVSDDKIPIYVAKILANRCSGLDPDLRTKLKEKIGRQIFNNEIAIPHIPSVCYAFVCLSRGFLPNGGVGNKEGMKEISTFVNRYIKKIVKCLNETVFTQIRRDIASRIGSCTPSIASQNPMVTCSQNNQVDPEATMRAIFTVGELIQYAPKEIDSKIFNMLRGLVAANKIDSDILANSQSTQYHPTKTVPRSVRAASVWALGKMSSEDIASRVAPVFIRQLRQDSDHCVRNNILNSMADICTIGTAAVSSYGDILASCMRDPSVLIRRHAVFLVTTLIRDEYLKWKGQVMYFFMGALLDPDEGVRGQVHASLINVLLPKFPKMLSNNFLETMFQLNNVVHPSNAVLAKQDTENCPLDVGDRFTLYGSAKASERVKIYKFMISTFDDTLNIQLMLEIAQKIPESISEEILNIENGNVACLLIDSLEVLRCKEIVLKMQTGKRSGGVDEIDDENEEAQHMEAIAVDTLLNIYMRMLYQDVLTKLFKLNDYLKEKAKTSGNASFGNLAKRCHAAYLDICENYIEHFDILLGRDSRRRDEIKEDFQRLRKKRIP